LSAHAFLDGFATAIAAKAALPPMSVGDAAACAMPLPGAKGVVVGGSAPVAGSLPASMIAITVSASTSAAAATAAAAASSSLSTSRPAAPTSAATPRPAAIAAAAARTLEQGHQLVDSDGAGHGPGGATLGGSLRRMMAPQQRRRCVDPE
jgi:pyruvate/2-oxoglutarate dehydrogenase complex dihydrolipoamide acyltransferase (E2) component